MWTVSQQNSESQNGARDSSQLVKQPEPANDLVKVSGSPAESARHRPWFSDPEARSHTGVVGAVSQR